MTSVSLARKHLSQRTSVADFLEKNWLKQSEQFYDKIDAASRDIRDILRISKNPKCKDCQSRIRKAINKMHNELDSIRGIDTDLGSFDEDLLKGKKRFMEASKEAQQACIDLQKIHKDLKHTVVPFVIKIQRIVKMWQPVRMVMEPERLHVQLSDFIQIKNKRCCVVLTLDTTGTQDQPISAFQKNNDTFFTDVTKSRKLVFAKSAFTFELRPNQRLRAHRGWHLLLLLLRPPRHKQRSHSAGKRPAFITAGMAKVDLGPIADPLLRGDECTLPLQFVQTDPAEAMAPAGATAAAAAAASTVAQPICRGKVTVHFIKQKELASIRQRHARMREEVIRKKSQTNQLDDPNVVQDQELQHRLNMLSDMCGGDSHGHVQDMLQNYLRTVPRPAQHIETKAAVQNYIRHVRALEDLERQVLMLSSAAIVHMRTFTDAPLQAVALSVLRAILLLLGESNSDLPATWIVGKAVLQQSGQNDILRRFRNCKHKHAVSQTLAFTVQEELMFTIDLIRLRSTWLTLANTLAKQLSGDPSMPPCPALVRAMTKHLGEGVQKLYCWAKQVCYCSLTLHDVAQRLMCVTAKTVHERTMAARKSHGGLPKINPMMNRQMSFKDKLKYVQEDIEQTDVDALIDELL